MISQIFIGSLTILLFTFLILNKRCIRRMWNNNLAMLLVAIVVLLPFLFAKANYFRIGIEANNGVEPGKVGTYLVACVFLTNVCPIALVAACIFLAVPKLRAKKEGNNAIAAGAIIGPILTIAGDESKTLYDFVTNLGIIYHVPELGLGIFIAINGRSFNKKDFMYLFVLILIYLGIVAFFTIIFGMDQHNSGIAKRDGTQGTVTNDKSQPGNEDGQFFIFTQILQIENVTDTNIHLIRFFGGMMMLLLTYIILILIQLFNGIMKKHEIKTKFDINQETIYEKFYYKYLNKIKSFKLKNKK